MKRRLRRVLFGLGLVLAAPFSPRAASAASATTNAPSSRTQEADTCSVVLDSVGSSEVNGVKVIKSITGLGLKEAKAIADAAGAASVKCAKQPRARKPRERQKPAGAPLCSVRLDKVGSSEVNVVKAIKSITGLGLKEAKAIADKAPVAIKTQIDEDEASGLRVQLEASGATASVTCATPSNAPPPETPPPQSPAP